MKINYIECVCVCLRERERERKTETERERERLTSSECQGNFTEYWSLNYKHVIKPIIKYARSIFISNQATSEFLTNYWSNDTVNRAE